MNIVFYHSSLQRGGAERCIVNLSNEFAEQNVVTIITIDTNPAVYEVKESVRHITLSGLKESHNFMEAIRNNISLIRNLRRELLAINPDVVICFGVNQLMHTYFARRKQKYIIIGSERTNPYEDPCGRFWNRMKKFLYNKVDGFIFQTKGAKSFYDKENNKGIIISNPISEEFMLERTKKIKERNKDIFYSFGRFTDEKNYDFLIRSFCTFHNSYVSCKLIIYGEGGKRQELESLIHKLNADSFIFLPGRINNVSEVMAEARYYILSSKREGMPNTLLEAMASGCVCIATNCNFGPADIICGDNGILIENNDEKQMVEALEKIYLDENIQEIYSQNAMQIRKTNCVNTIANKYLEYIKKLMNEGETGN